MQPKDSTMDNKLILIIGAAVIIGIHTIIKHLRLAKPDQLKSILSNRKYKLIDVRTIQEFENGHVNKAKNIPLHELLQKIKKFAPNKETPILVYCRSGARSGHAKKNLDKMGYTTVLNLGSLHRATEIMKQK